MPRSSMAWLSGVMFSRGMSHVSAIILATVSKVEDMDYLHAYPRPFTTVGRAF